MSDITYLPPCPTEDSANCYWDATVQGNSTGQSFATYQGDTLTYTVPEGHYTLNVIATPASPTGFTTVFQEYPVLPEFTVAAYDVTPIVIMAVVGLFTAAVIAVTAFVKRA